MQIHLNFQLSFVSDFVLDPKSCKLSGGYQLTLELDNRNRRTVSHHWNYDTKNKAAIDTNILVEVAIADYHKKYCLLYEEPNYTASTIELECYTRATIDGVVYHASSDFKGSPWYDWANVHFGETQDIQKVMNCASRIMGFFRYKTPNVPTYQRVEIDNLDWDDIVNSQEPDDTLYMVIHCSHDEIDFADIREHFVLKFVMTPIEELYILPVSMINGPLLVVPDMTEKDTFHTSNFMALLPRRQQGVYFRKYCKRDDIHFEVDMEETTRFDSDYEYEDSSQDSDNSLDRWINDDEDEYSSEEDSLDESIGSENVDSDEEDSDEEYGEMQQIGINEDDELAMNEIAWI